MPLGLSSGDPGGSYVNGLGQVSGCRALGFMILTLKTGYIRIYRGRETEIIKFLLSWIKALNLLSTPSHHHVDTICGYLLLGHLSPPQQMNYGANPATDQQPSFYIFWGS